MLLDIEPRPADVEGLCRRFGVHHLEVFGSAATSVFQDTTSDLDFLVKFENPGRGIADRFFGLQESLQALFGRPVDLVVEPAMKNPYFRESVDKTRALLYAA